MRVLAVAEDHHDVAGRVEEVERLVEPDDLIDGLRDDRPLIRKHRELDRIADERDAQQDVVVVVRERRDDVGLVAELDEAEQVALLALHPQLDEPLGGGHGGEERGSVAARLLRLAAVNGVRMLIDASISRPIRRPGNDSSRLTSAV